MPNIPSIKIGNTNYDIKDTTAREHLIEVSAEQPSSPDNRLWINKSAAENEYQIPTYAEFSGAKNAVDTTATYYEFINGQTIYYPEFDVAADYSTPLTKYEKVGNALIVAPCQKGDVFYVKGCGESSNRLWTVAQSDGTAIQTSAKNLDYSTLTKVEITWDNAWYIVVNSKTSVREAALIKVDEKLLSQKLLDRINDDGNIVSDNVEFITGHKFYYYEKDKAANYSTPLTKFNSIGNALITADCKKGDVFYIKGSGHDSVRLWTVCSSDGTAIQTASPPKTAYPDWTRFEITWDNAAYLVINSVYVTTVPGAIKVNEKTLPTNLENRISNLEDRDLDLESEIDNSIGSIIKMKIKPEDFTGTTLADKVKNAVAFMNACGGSCELYFGDSQEYVISEAITLPSNTKVVINNCTIKLVDEVHDNVFRTANLIPDENDRNDICTCTGKLNNISIIGQGTALICGPDVRYVGPTIKSETPEEWVGDAFGWRGHTTLFVGVNAFEVSGLTYQNCICWENVFIGCSNGKVHDISSNSGHKNNDIVDVLTGCKYIDVYNISGYSKDDAVAIASCDNTRASAGVTPPIYPILPIGYEDYTFGSDTHDINVNNVCTSGTTGHQLVILTGKNKIYNVHASDISDTGTTKRSGVVKVYGSYLSTYLDGNIYGIYINNVSCNVTTKCIIIAGVPHDSIFNKIVVNNDATPVDRSGQTPTYEEANFVISNIIENS